MPAIQAGRGPCDTVSLGSLDPPMDVEALEQAALAAVAAASSTDAIESVRLEYLRRKSEIPPARPPRAGRGRAGGVGGGVRGGERGPQGAARRVAPPGDGNDLERRPRAD